ncbi:hypothetical protein [Shewanella subflava]|uniref:Uncharacterized protein n=1 Tax=Shewanella subflava TaxID=2986476 RepID=A0ABT3I5K6_9GAMM|nr:hypothetical protein [Shewanella subflava]MCW3171249.1 hypothetical protein [Shewanella subflava]
MAIRDESVSDFEYYAHVQKDDVVSFFNLTIGNKPCHLCGAGELQILGDQYGLITVNSEVNVFSPSAAQQMDNGTFSSYVVMCDYCGCQQFLNVKKLADTMSGKK